MSKNHDAATAKLAKNTIIYIMGNFGSKILQFLILPILTMVLLTEEYGYYDLVITTINLVSPLITLQLIEAIFRFLFDENKHEQKKTVSTVISFLVISFIIFGLVIYILNSIIEIKYPFLIYLNFISYILFSFLQKMARSIQKNVNVAISGVLNTCVMLLVEGITLLVFDMRIDGLLLANCISYLIASIYLEYIIRLEKWIAFDSISINKLKYLLKYSLPLVPNSICWWMVAACDKYVITFFVSIAANGIYSVAGKFSQLLTMITGVFQMAWQESSIMESNNKSRAIFYSSTFNSYVRFLLGGYIVFLPLIRILMPYFVADSYQVGYLYSPILLIGSVFSALSQFYGSAYLAFKKTGGAFYTTIIAVLVNIIIGVGLVNYIGVFAPALGTAISFFVQWILRVYQMKSFFRLYIDKKIIIILGIISIIATFLYYIDSMVCHVVSLIIGGIVFFVVNRKLILGILNKVLKRNFSR